MAAQQSNLFPPDMMEKIKEAHRMLELEKENARLKAELSYERHAKARYIGAFKKLKNKKKST